MQAQLDVLGGKQRALQRYRERDRDDRCPWCARRPRRRQRLPEAAAQRVSAARTRGDDARRAGADAARDRAPDARRPGAEHRQHRAPGPDRAAPVRARPARASARAERARGDGPAARSRRPRTFIFDVRPMVLDDLGLVPTLRRSAAERSRRSACRCASSRSARTGGLPTEVESGLFRMIDDAVGGLRRARARRPCWSALDWSETAVRATIRARVAQAATRRPSSVPAPSLPPRAATRPCPTSSPSMIHQQEEDEAARNAGLPDNVRAELEQRAAPLGIAVDRQRGSLAARADRGRAEPAARCHSWRKRVGLLASRRDSRPISSAYRSSLRSLRPHSMDSYQTRRVS